MEISELQKDLAAAFRWTAKLNMHEGIANHFSVCKPNSNDFYVNGSGMHFSTIKASDLVLVEQNKIEEIKKNTDLVDPTAINIHGIIHKKVPHAKCILHVHSKYATALSVLKNPILPPIDQNTMRFYNRVAVYDDFGGLGFEEESNKMANSIGNNRSMLLANHGILTTGQTVAEAFDELYYYFKINEHHQIFNRLKKKFPNYLIKFLLNIFILRFDKSIRYVAIILAFLKFKNFLKKN